MGDLDHFRAVFTVAEWFYFRFPCLHSKMLTSHLRNQRQPLR